MSKSPKFFGGADDDAPAVIPTPKKKPKPASAGKPKPQTVERVAKASGFGRRVGAAADPPRRRGRPKAKVRKGYWSIYLPTDLRDEILNLRDERDCPLHELLADMLEAYKKEAE